MKILNEQTEFEMEHPEINKDALLLSESVNLSLQLLKLPYFLGRSSFCRPHVLCHGFDNLCKTDNEVYYLF